MNPRKILIAGQFVESGNTFPVVEPSTGNALAEVFSGDRQAVARMLEAAESSALELKRLPSFDLSNGLAAIAEGISGRSDEFAESIAKEAGKPIRYARGEVARAVETFKLAAEEVKRFSGELINTEANPGSVSTEGFTVWEPTGIVVGICPFNFPLNLVAHKVAPALASRNPIIIKPSEKTPLTALMLAEVFLESGLPKESLQVAAIDLDLLPELLADERVKTISFTGSDRVGWNLKAQYPRKQVFLELGGNAPVIVDSVKDIESVADRIVFGAFAYSGQVCISVQRVVAVSSVAEELAKVIAEKAEALVYGDVLDDETEVSEMITGEAAISTIEMIGRAIEEGARVLTGGSREGSFVKPTVLTNVSENSAIVSEEAFAPLVVVETVEDFASAVQLVNKSRFGLQAGVFTDSMSNADIAIDRLEYGGVIINDVPTFRVDGMPYGGFKESGNTKEGVKYAMKEMSRMKLVVRRKAE